jgi:hypothetical protein
LSRQTKYVKLANSLLSILKHSRISLYLSKKSNRIFNVWQHIVLLAMRQYENKSYRRFVEWLEEAVNLLQHLQLKRIPHFTTLQKFTARISNSLLQRLLLSFVTIYYHIQEYTIGIDATGFKSAFSQYYENRIATVIDATNHIARRRTFIKNTICADTNRQLICRVKIRHSYAHDNTDFIPVLSAIQKLPISLVVADKGDDDEKNHQFVRECLLTDCIIPTRFESVPVWKTRGRYRKQMKRGYSKQLYHQRNKVETIFSVIKRMFGEYIRSKMTRTRNRDMVFRCIAYNMHRYVKLLIVVWFLHSHNILKSNFFIMLMYFSIYLVIQLLLLLLIKY